MIGNLVENPRRPYIALYPERHSLVAADIAADIDFDDPLAVERQFFRSKKVWAAGAAVGLTGIYIAGQFLSQGSAEQRNGGNNLTQTSTETARIIEMPTATATLIQRIEATATQPPTEVPTATATAKPQIPTVRPATATPTTEPAKIPETVPATYSVFNGELPTGGTIMVVLLDKGMLILENRWYVPCADGTTQLGWFEGRSGASLVDGRIVFRSPTIDINLSLNSNTLRGTIWRPDQPINGRGCQPGTAQITVTLRGVGGDAIVAAYLANDRLTATHQGIPSTITAAQARQRLQTLCACAF